MSRVAKDRAGCKWMDETRCHEPLQRQIPSTSITQHLVSTFSLLAVQQSVMTQFTESYESQPKATQTRGTLDSILGFWCGANKFEHLTHSLRTILCSLWVAQIVRISIIHVQHKDSSLVITLSCAVVKDCFSHLAGFNPILLIVAGLLDLSFHQTQLQVPAIFGIPWHSM